MHVVGNVQTVSSEHTQRSDIQQTYFKNASARAPCRQAWSRRDIFKICCCCLLATYEPPSYLSWGLYGVETIWYLTLDAHWGWSCGGVWDAAAMPALPLAYINTGFSVVRLLCLSVCLICSTSFEYDVNLAPWIKEECEVIFIRRSCLLTAQSSWMRLRPVDCRKEYGLLGKTNTCSCSPSFCLFWAGSVVPFPPSAGS